VRKTYQNEEIDTSQPIVPEAVSVALAELAGEVQEGLLALAVGAGLQVLTALMEQDVTVQCGVKGRHDPTRTATRHGHGAGSVTLGGRRVPVARPRMRASDGSGELPVPAYELFSRTEVLGRMAMERTLAGLSTRRYPVGLEPVGTRVEQRARATSKSAVSRRFVTATETALAELLSVDLSGLDLVALMVTGCTSPSTAVWWLWASISTVSSTRCRWWKAQLRTPPWSPSCWSGCASAAWRACHDNCVSHGWTKIGRRDHHSVGKGTICESGHQHRRL
jgi:hypothetical protein